MFAAPVSRVRFPAADVTKTCPETTPTTTDLPGTGGEAPPVGPMPRTRISDSAPDDVSHAATPMWSAAAAARSWPMPCAPVWVSSGPDCQLRAVVRRRVVELQARGGVVSEHGMQAPRGILGEMRLGVVALVGDLHAGGERRAVEPAHGQHVRLGPREQEQARRAAREARVVGVADVDRRRPARGVVEGAGAAAELRLARAVGEDRDRRIGVGEPHRPVVRVVGREDRAALAGRAAVERDVLDASPSDSALVVDRQRVARVRGPPRRTGRCRSGCPASKVAPPSAEVNSQISSKRAPVSP